MPVLCRLCLVLQFARAAVAGSGSAERGEEQLRAAVRDAGAGRTVFCRLGAGSRAAQCFRLHSSSLITRPMPVPFLYSQQLSFCLIHLIKPLDFL